METNTKTIGEMRVRTEFNPANNDIVAMLKNKTADLINMLAACSTIEPRLIAIAMTEYENACMWAVKAVTTQQSAPMANPGSAPVTQTQTPPAPQAQGTGDASATASTEEKTV